MGAVVDSLHAGSLACVSSGDLVSGDANCRLTLTSLALLLGHVIKPLGEMTHGPVPSTYICVVGQIASLTPILRPRSVSWSGVLWLLVGEVVPSSRNPVPVNDGLDSVRSLRQFLDLPEVWSTGLALFYCGAGRFSASPEDLP